MQLDILPMSDPSYNCFHIAVATLAVHNKSEYQMIAAGSLGINYGEGIRIGEKISIRSRYLIDIDSINKFHGIAVEFKRFRKESAASEIISYLESATPLIMFSDLYWCPWTLAYQKYNFIHMFIIIGFDEAHQQFICIDPYFTTEVIKVEYDKISPGIRNYGIVKFERAAPLLSDYYKTLNDDLNDFLYNESNNTIQNILKFADDIENCSDFKKEFEGYGEALYAVPLFEKVRSIYICRCSYSRLLKYIGNKLDNDELILLSDDMLKCANSWRKIRDRLIKLSMRSEYTAGLISIAKTIREIAEMEKENAIEIVNLINVAQGGK